jgi:hypothetical protein
LTQVYYNKHGKPPASADVLLAAMEHPHFDNTHSYPSETTTRRDKYVIARNPYARFLSEYLEHHSNGCVGGAGRGCVGSKDPTKHPEALVKPTRETFGAWAEQTLKHGGEPYACAHNHHVCSQMRSCAPQCLAWPPIVLKLERQAEWFEFFVGHVGASAFNNATPRRWRRGLGPRRLA